MEKKHISIIGSCVSRDLFNTTTLGEIFEVDKYAFKTCVWDFFNKDAFDIDVNVYKSLNIPEFMSRMIWYDLNKVTIAEIESAHSEYLMIDLLNISYDIDKVTYGNKTVYVQEIYDRLSNYSTQIRQKKEFNEVSWKRESFKDFNKEIIKKGLKLFADWAKEHYEEEKIIINIPWPADKFINLDNNIVPFNQEVINTLHNAYSIVKEYSQLFHSYLPNAIVLDDVGDKFAAFGMHDMTQQIPPSIHYSTYDYYRQSSKLLSLLGCEDPKINNIPSFAWDYIKTNNLYRKAARELFYLKAQSKNISNISLNNYFDYIDNLKDIIVIISAKDEASKNIKNLYSKKFFEYKLNYRDSYIAILDKRRNYIYEESSKSKIEIDYKVDNFCVNIISSNFENGNNSSIKINNIEYSKNHRGLNIVLLNSKTLELVDSAYCDSWADESLKVVSDYFNNIKIKI